MNALAPFAAVLLLLLASPAASWGLRPPQLPRPLRLGRCSASIRMVSAGEQYRLTPKLLETVEGLRSLPDDKMRYKQLLYMATQCADLESAPKRGQCIRA